MSDYSEINTINSLDFVEYQSNNYNNLDHGRVIRLVLNIRYASYGVTRKDEHD